MRKSYPKMEYRKDTLLKEEKHILEIVILLIPLTKRHNFGSREGNGGIR
jgi:hypothetical protein